MTSMTSMISNSSLQLWVFPSAQTRAEVARNPKLRPINCFKVIRVDSPHTQALMVPEANRLLEEIGTAFVDRLKADQLPSIDLFSLVPPGREKT